MLNQHLEDFTGDDLVSHVVGMHPVVINHPGSLLLGLEKVHEQGALLFGQISDGIRVTAGILQ